MGSRASREGLDAGKAQAEAGRGGRAAPVLRPGFDGQARGGTELLPAPGSASAAAPRPFHPCKAGDSPRVLSLGTELQLSHGLHSRAKEPPFLGRARAGTWGLTPRLCPPPREAGLCSSPRETPPGAGRQHCGPVGCGGVCASVCVPSNSYSP